MYRCVLGVCLAIVMEGVALGANAAPPRVVHAEPDNADIGVDPALKHLRIEFDQDMSPRGMSICGGGEKFPKIASEITWESPRVLLVPVSLEAGRSYALSINCSAAGNFRSITGESAEAYPIEFTTAAPGEKPATMNEDDARAAVGTLRRLVAEQYSYRDRVVTDWDAQFARHESAMLSARTPGAFGRSAALLLRAAQDPHVVIRVDDHAIGTDQAAVRSNFHLECVRKAVKDFASFGRNVGVGTLPDGVQYCLIGGWDRSDETDVRRAIGHLVRTCGPSAKPECTGIVLDVRPNGGGNELLAREVASLFAQRRAVYSRNRTIMPGSKEGWSATFDRVLEPAEPERRIGVPVAVLMGGQCMSSNESFLRMMRTTPNARLFGDISRGSSGRPIAHDVCAHVRVLLPSWQDLDPDGSPTEGRGVQPHETVPWDMLSERDTDPVLHSALRWLEAQRAGRK